MRKALIAALVAVPAVVFAALWEKLLGREPIGATTIVALVLAAALWTLLAVTFALERNGRRNAAGQLWLVVGSTAAAYGLLDGGVSYFLKTSLSPPIVLDRQRHHMLQPGTTSEFRTDEFAYVLRVNSSGLRRSADVPNQKPPNQYRILMLGDSFTMGKGVADADTFSALLETALASAFQQRGKQIQVLNGGVDSYAPILSFLQLRSLIAMQPDLVVLNLDMSDLVQESVYRQRADYGRNGEIIGVDGRQGGGRLARTVNAWVERHFYITRWLLHLLGRTLAGARDADSVLTQANLELLRHTLATDSADRQQQWAWVFESVSAIKGLCDERGSRFLLTTYPWGHQVGAREWSRGRAGFVPDGVPVSDRSLERITEFAAGNRIEFHSLFPVLRAYGGAEPLYFSQDMHWTRTGHRVVAQELGRSILSIAGFAR